MQGTKVLVTRMLPGVAVELLKENGFVVTAWTEELPMTQEQLIAQAKNHEALLCSLTDKIDPYFLSQCSHLKVISQFGVGYDNINIQEATRLKIPVGNTPDVLTDATADVAFALMINASRKMFYQHKLIEKGQWKSFKTMSHLGIELKGKTLGIFGLGRIGNVMAKRCVGAFDMKVIYHNRKPLSPDQNHFNARYVSFDELAAESDVLSVHASLSDSTRGLFDKKVFSKMKPTSIFVNTARGAVHNEIDLIDALKTGKIWGAGLDVTNPEPMQPDNPLLQMENVAVLPHIGSATIEARTGMAQLAAENIIGFFKEGRVPNLVNKELAGSN